MCLSGFHLGATYAPREAETHVTAVSGGLVYGRIVGVDAAATRADGNLRLYSYDRLFFALYGYDGGTTRTYKYSFDLNPQWVNGRLEAVNFNLHNAMFYPNAYINFNNNGYYTKHYYNGMERIASRLGDQNLPIHTHDPELQDRKDWQDSLIRKNIVEITGYEFLEPGEEQNHEDPKHIPQGRYGSQFWR